MRRFLNLLALILLTGFVSPVCSAAGAPKNIPASAWQIARFHMVTARQGWALGSYRGREVLMKTRNGGRRWADVSPPGLMGSVDYVDYDQRSFGTFFPDAHTAWIGQGEELRHTSNGGRTWSRRSFHVSETVGDEYLDIQFPDARHGFLLGTGQLRHTAQHKAIYRTRDGGKTWAMILENDKPKSILPPMGGSLGMIFRSARDGWLSDIEPDAMELGSSSYDPVDPVTLYKTHDGGRTWLPQHFANPAVFGHQEGYASVPQFFGRNQKEGVVLVTFSGRKPNKHGFTVYVTHTGGRKWRSSQGIITLGNYFYGGFADAKHGWVWDGFRLYATRNGGRNWTATTKAIPALEGEDRAEDMQFVTSRDGWLLEQTTRNSDESFNSRLLRTRDGGKHWERL